MGLPPGSTSYNFSTFPWELSASTEFSQGHTCSIQLAPRVVVSIRFTLHLAHIYHHCSFHFLTAAS